jgi:glycosyltransferase involved in cell wall biosynthesis
MRTIAVIPALNEATRIGAVVAAVRPYVNRVIVVDDGSTDTTAEVAATKGAQVVRHILNRGQGAALKTGTLAALADGADVIVHIDADGQHDPTAIPALMNPIIHDEADVVFGSRFLGISPRGMPAVRRMYFHAARVFNTLLLGIPRTITDPQSGARALSRAAAEHIDFCQDGPAHCSEILKKVTRSTLRWREVPVLVRYTEDTLRKGQRFTVAFQILWQLIVRH